MGIFSRRLRRASQGRRLLCVLTFALVVSQTCSPALAVVPIGNTVPLLGNAGNFSSAVQITNNQGAQGTATLFMEKIDPANPNYLDLCFVTADHVMRNTVGGPAYENDTLPYDGLDNYGGTPAAMQPGPRDLLSSIGVGSQSDPTGFTLSSGNAIIASQVKLGDAIDKINGKPTDIAFVGITVDMTKLPMQNNPLLALNTAANILNGMPAIPLALSPTDPNAAGGAPFDFSVKGGYGVSGTFDPAFNQYDWVYHPVLAAEDYGRERAFQNTVQLYKTVSNGVYEYKGMQWNNGLESNAIQLAGTGGMGMPGDSGSALLVNNKITGILTAGRMDSLPAGQLGILPGALELGAQITPNALAALNGMCANYTYATAVPEPSTCVLAVFGAAMVGGAARRKRRAVG